MIKVDRLAVGRACRIDQLDGGRLVEIEALLEQGMQLAALDLRHVAVDGGDMDQQRRRGEPIIVLLEMILPLRAAGEVG